MHCQQGHLGLSVLICKMGRIQFSLQSCCKGHELTLGMGLEEHKSQAHMLVVSIAICLSAPQAGAPDSLHPLPHQANPERETHPGANACSLGNGVPCCLWRG